MYKNANQTDTLNIVQYLYFINCVLLPTIIVERNHPVNVTELPTILYNDRWYSGLSNVLLLYESMSGIDNLLERSVEFKRTHPKYTINP